MANTEIDHLVSMANDIAANLGFQEDATARVADHIQRFWAPRMRKLLLGYARTDADDLSPTVRAALDLLKDQ